MLGKLGVFARESGDDLTMRDQIVAQLQEQANTRAAEGMARFGIRGAQVRCLHPYLPQDGKNQREESSPGVRALGDRYPRGEHSCLDD